VAGMRCSKVEPARQPVERRKIGASISCSVSFRFESSTSSFEIDLTNCSTSGIVKWSTLVRAQHSCVHLRHALTHLPIQLLRARLHSRDHLSLGNCS
jgi:hypothetical protein